MDDDQNDLTGRTRSVLLLAPLPQLAVLKFRLLAAETFACDELQ